jgi:hypothetical protein
MAGLNQGETPSRKIRFKAHDLLVTTNRQTSGQGYKLLRQAKSYMPLFLFTAMFTGYFINAAFYRFSKPKIIMVDT